MQVKNLLYILKKRIIRILDSQKMVIAMFFL